MPHHNQRYIGRHTHRMSLHQQAVIDYLVPAIFVGEMSQCVGITVRAVPAMVVRNDRVAVRHAGLCESVIACGVFAETVQQLNDSTRLLLWSPQGYRYLVGITGLQHRLLKTGVIAPAMHRRRDPRS